MRPKNVSELIEALLRIRMSSDENVIHFTKRDVDTMLDILKRTRENVLRHGRTAFDAQELLEETESWGTYLSKAPPFNLFFFRG